MKSFVNAICPRWSLALLPGGLLLLLPLLLPAQEAPAVGAAAEKKETTEKPGFFARGEDLEGRKVDISEGEIPVREFLQYLADETGRPVITGNTLSLLEQRIAIVSTIRDADEDIVKAILEVNGWQVSEKELPDGREVLAAELLQAGRPVVLQIEAETESPRKEVVFRQARDGLAVVEGRESPLSKEGVGPEDMVSVVTSLDHLDIQSAVQTLQNIFPRGGRPDQYHLRATPVEGTETLILTGKARDVDHALRILEAVDIGREEESAETETLIEIIELESADPDQMVQLLQELVPAGSSPTRVVRRTLSPSRTSSRSLIRTRRPTSSSTRIFRDQRTRKIIVRTPHPDVLEIVHALVKEFDVPVSVEKAPELQTRVIRLKHAPVDSVARVLQEMVLGSSTSRIPVRPGPGTGSSASHTRILTYQETNSLVVKAPEEEIAEIEKLLELIDVPVPDTLEDEPEDATQSRARTSSSSRRTTTIRRRNSVPKPVEKTPNPQSAEE